MLIENKIIEIEDAVESTNNKKIPLLIEFENSYVNGDWDDGRFWLVTEHFYNLEGYMNDSSTFDGVYSDYYTNCRLIPKSMIPVFEEDLYLENLKGTVLHNGHSYRFNFECSESNHICTKDGNKNTKISHQELIDVLNSAWKYFKIVRII